MSMTVGMNANVLGILSQLSQLDAAQSATMARLSTGNRINKASDDPSGVVALNSLNSQLASVNAAIEGNQRGQSMLDVVDSTLTEVNTLVSEIQGLVEQSQGSGVTAEEKAAFQAQIDNAVNSIDSLIGGAEFNGEKLFNGDNRINAYAATADADAVKDIRVFSRDPNVTGNVSLTVNVTAAADYAYTDSASGFDLTNGLSASTVVQVTGKLGTATITMSTLNAAQIKAAINAQKDVTGVSSVTGGVSGRLVYCSTDKGSDDFVAVSVISGDEVMMANGSFSKVSGTDAQATVNGATANAQGTEVFYNGTGLSLSFNLEDDTPGAHTITVSGGGAEFKVGTDSTSRVALGLANLNSFELGRSDLGYLDSLKSGGANSLTATDTEAADIVKEASGQVATAAARIGSFIKYQLAASTKVLQAEQEGLTTAVSQIQSTDYALETANLQREQVLANAATSMLSVALSQQANVLALLQ